MTCRPCGLLSAMLSKGVAPPGSVRHDLNPALGLGQRPERPGRPAERRPEVHQLANRLLKRPVISA